MGEDKEKVLEVNNLIQEKLPATVQVSAAPFACYVHLKQEIDTSDANVVCRELMKNTEDL